MIVDGAEWKRRGCANGCALVGTGECEGPVQAHHVVTRQALRRHGLLGHVYDVRNSMCLCYRHHRRHSNGTERVPYETLTTANLAFAREVGLDWHLENYYPPSGGYPGTSERNTLGV